MTKQTKLHRKKHNEGQTIMTWVSPEYIAHRKGKRWYIVAGIVVVAVVAYALYSGNWSMAAAVIVFTGVYQHTHHYHPPKNMDVLVTDLGIRVGHLFFPYSHIQAFWIIYKPDFKTLNLRVTGNFWADVVVQLNDQDPCSMTLPVLTM